jgi:hypothetical protein
MFLRLKISVYNIEVGLPSILKAPLDYNLYILIVVVGLNYVLILFLVIGTEHLFCLFSLPLLYRTLITLYIHSLLLPPYMPIRYTPR